MVNETLYTHRQRDGEGSGSYNLPYTNEKGEVFSAGGLPAGTEYTRQGKRWSMMSVAAVAGLVVRPSTTAALEIHNGYDTGGPSLIIERLFWFNLVSTNVVESYGGWAMVTKLKSAPTAEATALVLSPIGDTYGGSVIGDFSTTVVDNGWYPWGGFTKGAAGVTPQAPIVAEVAGRLIVKPGHSLCLHVVSSLVGQTFTQGAEWIEETISY